MGDGWETRRRRTKGYDWIIFKFGIPGYISDISIDTSHFKGNYPDKFSIQGNYIQENKNISKTKIINDSTNWKYIINNEYFSSCFTFLFMRLNSFWFNIS